MISLLEDIPCLEKNISWSVQPMFFDLRPMRKFQNSTLIFLMMGV